MDLSISHHRICHTCQTVAWIKLSIGFVIPWPRIISGRPPGDCSRFPVVVIVDSTKHNKTSLSSMQLFFVRVYQVSYAATMVRLPVAVNSQVALRIFDSSTLELFLSGLTNYNPDPNPKFTITQN